MSRDLEPFDFHGQPVRVLTDDQGDPHFVLADVCAALGIANARDTAARLPEDAVGQTDTIDSLGRKQTVNTVSESGFYRVVLRSDKPQAEPFIRWVTSEVLPAIRRTGSYSNIPKTYSEALRELASSVEARELAEARAKELEAPAAAWTRLASASGDYSLNQAAKILSRDPGIEIGERRLFAALEALNWVYRDRRFGGNGAWTAYQAAIDCGRLVHRTRSHEHPHTGVIVLDAPQVRVTVKGLADLHKHLGGIEPLAKSLPSSEPVPA